MRRIIERLVRAIAIAATAAAVSACRQTAALAPQAGALKGWNVVVVTIDTLRADHVGAYGSPLGLTPTLDRLAREGLRVPVAHAHVPLTLPSHATILTGLYPTTNGVHDNGTFHLDASKPTLATALKAAGYRTGAFIGAFVLDARYGLNHGFDVYDDRLSGNSAVLEVVQRTAEDVLKPASTWILDAGPEPGKGPFLTWIHLYDPHEPYEAPEPYRTRYASDPYSGEVAYTDAALGAFLDRLQSAALLDRTLVVVMSDHGESLGEHGERTHGLFAYESTLRVPLIFWAKNGLAPGVLDAPARLVDVMPTILDLVGVQAPAPMDGRSLRPFIGGAQPFDRAPSYFEALNASLTRGWAPLKGVIADGTKLIDLPQPELYDLGADAAEAKNVYASQPERARVLESVLDNFSRAAAPISPTRMDADAEARLRALGYVAASAQKPGKTYTAADDPKKLVHLDAAMDDAMAQWSRGNAAGAVDTLRAVIKERPDLTIAYDRLAYVLRASGRPADAVALLDDAARSGHADAPLLRSLAGLLRETANLPRSASILETLIKQDPGDAQSMDALGQTYASMRRTRDAEALFKRVLTVSPNAATTWNNLGVLYLQAGRGAEAVDALSHAVSINPTLAGAHNALGVAYAKQGETDRAVEEWRKALAIRPDLEEARANLERVGAR